MMILGIQGSPRKEKSRTRFLVESVLAGAKEAGADVLLVNCTDYVITHCIACENCAKTGRCVHNDDFPQIYDLLRNTDGVVFGSPVYIDQVSGQMKILIDRLADSIHNQVLGERYGCSVATTFISGGSEVVAYLDHVIQYLGAMTIEGMSVSLKDDPEAILNSESAARNLGRQLVEAIVKKPVFPVQQAEIMYNRKFFEYIVESNRETRPGEYER